MFYRVATFQTSPKSNLQEQHQVHWLQNDPNWSNIFDHHSLCKCFTSNSDEDDWGVNTHFLSKLSKYDRFQKIIAEI